MSTTHEESALYVECCTKVVETAPKMVGILVLPECLARLILIFDTSIASG